MAAFIDNFVWNEEIVVNFLSDYFKKKIMITHLCNPFGENGVENHDRVWFWSHEEEKFKRTELLLDLEEMRMISYGYKDPTIQEIEMKKFTEKLEKFKI